MRERALAMLLPGLLVSCSLHAQIAPKSNLPTQAARDGMKMFRQRCSICHVPVAPGERTYGPILSADLVAGRISAVRDIIWKGTARMPGFQYALQPQQVDDLIAYLQTVKKEDRKKQPEGGGAPPD
jgi:mono/diheme cytochrome c family protein